MEMMSQETAQSDAPRPSAANNTAQSAPYMSHLPAAPFMYGPGLDMAGSTMQTPAPSTEHANSMGISLDELAIITQNKAQTAENRCITWTYEMRREAQAMLDFLYLGPNGVLRDHGFLRSAGITMIIVARDSAMGTRSLLSVEKAKAELGIEAHYVDVEGPHQVISSFPKTIKLINRHLLEVHHSRARVNNENGQLPLGANGGPRGKVLVTCESGTDRSGAIVAAYLMTMYGQDMLSAVQFIIIQRFCCCFDQDVKSILKTWEDMLRAQSAVTQHAQSQPQTGGGRAIKRRISDTMEHIEQSTSTPEGSLRGGERFFGRAPFLDTAPS